MSRRTQEGNYSHTSILTPAERRALKTLVWTIVILCAITWIVPILAVIW